MSRSTAYDQLDCLLTHAAVGMCGKASYVYDGLGHRVKVNSADGTSLLQIYSPAGQLLYTKQSGGPSAAKNTRYIYLNRHLIAEAAQ